MKSKDSKIDASPIRNRIATVSELPKDVVLHMPLLSLTGRSELHLENYRGIVEYTDVMIRIQTKIGLIKITGANLQVEYYTNDDMKLIGDISSIEYQNLGG